MTDETELIWALEAEYDRHEGFLGRLRTGDFDPAGLERTLTLLESVDLGESLVVNRRLVALVWMIPTVMSWQLEGVAKKGGDVDGVRRGIDRSQAVLDALLGTP